MYINTQAQIDKLKKMNVFNATFHIWHVGHFATINGFRHVVNGILILATQMEKFGY